MVDNTIALQLQSPKLESPLNRMARGMQMLAFKAQADTAQQTTTQNALLNEAYRNATSPTGEVDLGKLTSSLATSGGGSAIPAAQTAYSASVGADIKAKQAALDHVRSNADYAMTHLGLANTPDDARAIIQDMLAQKRIDPETARMALARVPTDVAKLPAFKREMLLHALSAEKQVEMKFENVDLGDRRLTIAYPATGGAAIEVPGSQFPVAPKPGSGGDGKETFFGNVQFAQDANGNTLMGQPSNKGGPIQWQRVPPELKVLLPTRTDDTGTSLVTRQTLGGGEVGRTAKDVLGEALQAAVGKEEAAQLMAAPGAVASGTRFLAQLDDLAADPNLERGTGLSSYFNFVRSSDGKSFQVKLNKAQGSAFLEAIKGLRGTGAITETEGSAATSSLSGLDAGLDAASFKREIELLRAMVKAGLIKAREKDAKRARILGEPAPTTPETATPAPAAPAAGGAPAPGHYIWNPTTQKMEPAP